MSPRSRKSDSNEDDVLIDFTIPELSHVSPPCSDVAVADDGEILLTGPDFTSTRPVDSGGMCGKLPNHSQPSPAFDMIVADDGEILLVGPNYTGTQSFKGGTSREFPWHSQNASNAAVDDDAEILLAGPNCTLNQHFLDGGKFGEFPSEIGIRKTVNPFVVDILAMSSCSEATVSNGAVQNAADIGLSRDRYTADDELLTVVPDTGTGIAFRRSPFTGRVLSSAVGHAEARWSPGCGEVTGPLLSFRPQDVVTEPTPSHPQVVSVPAAGRVMAPVPGPAAVLCETNLDESMSSTSPVAFVVSSKRRWRVLRPKFVGWTDACYVADCLHVYLTFLLVS